MSGIPSTYAVYSIDYGKLLSLKRQKAGQDLVNAMVASLDQDSPWRQKQLSTAMEILYRDQKVGQLKTVCDTVVASEGIESGNLEKIVPFSKPYLIDDLLLL